MNSQLNQRSAGLWLPAAFLADRAAEISGGQGQRGVALLIVMWLAVALSFMAMATAHLVRTEVAAVGNQIDAQRGYYLARGGIEAAIYSMAHPAVSSPGDTGASVLSAEYRNGKRWLQYDLPGGSSIVEVVPETAKLNVNQAPPEQLAALFETLGVPANESSDLAAAIVEWRSPRTSGVDTALDIFYGSLPQPYLARHATLEQLEELLPVKGMSQSIFFGRTERTSDRRWVKRPSLADLLTTQNGSGAVNPIYAPYEVLRSLPGWDDSMAAGVIAARTASPMISLDDLRNAVPQISMAGGLASLTASQGSVYTLTATGLLPGSGVRRSVRALVTVGNGQPLFHRVLGWWDEWPTPGDLPPAAGNTNEKGSPGQS